MENLKNIMAFVVLMSGEKALDHSAGYVIEKFKRYCLTDNLMEYKWGLDADNTKILNAWVKKWTNQ